MCKTTDAILFGHLLCRIGFPRDVVIDRVMSYEIRIGNDLNLFVYLRRAASV